MTNSQVMESQGLIISLMAVAVSVASFYFSVNSWRQSNRPIVIVRVTSFGLGGNIATPLSILVENTGNRPAKNIRLRVEKKVLDNALLRHNEDKKGTEAIEDCFSERGTISILANGKSVSNNFGLLQGQSEGSWKLNTKIEILVSYEDLDGRRFEHKNPLLLADDRGFAGSFWKSAYAGAEKPKDG